MKYIDLHTDALTKEGVLSVTGETLKKGGCMLQCFACFTPRGGMEDTMKLCDKFEKMCTCGGFQHVKCMNDLSEKRINAMLSVEGGEAIEGELGNLERLYGRGVRMMTLVWNYGNALGSPHGQKSGLTPFGHSVVEKMGNLHMIADVSHGSEALFYDVAEWSKRTKIPFVASHSDARACRFHTRNLSDGQIRLLAACGGVMGLNFCAEFLSPDKSAEGQKTALIAHITHILKVGGEDVPCFGSDFDGIPRNAYMKTAADMPRLIGELERRFPARIVEKIAYKNAERVLGDVLG